MRIFAPAALGRCFCLSPRASLCMQTRDLICFVCYSSGEFSFGSEETRCVFITGWLSDCGVCQLALLPLKHNNKDVPTPWANPLRECWFPESPVERMPITLTYFFHTLSTTFICSSNGRLHTNPPSDAPHFLPYLLPEPLLSGRGSGIRVNVLRPCLKSDLLNRRGRHKGFRR